MAVKCFTKEWQLDIDCEWLRPEEEMAALEDLSAALAQAWSRYPGGSLEEEDRNFMECCKKNNTSYGHFVMLHYVGHFGLKCSHVQDFLSA